MAATVLEKPEPANQRGNILTWVATIFACAYIAWSGVSLYHATAAFKEMYMGMGVELSTPTRFITATYRWLFPILFGGVIGVVVSKQFLVREKWASLVITLAALVGLEVTASAIIRALYQPVLELTEKLSK